MEIRGHRQRHAKLDREAKRASREDAEARARCPHRKLAHERMDQRCAQASEHTQTYSQLSRVRRDIGVERDRIEVMKRARVRLETARLYRAGNSGCRDNDQRRHLETCLKQRTRIQCEDNNGRDPKRIQRPGVAAQPASEQICRCHTERTLHRRPETSQQSKDKADAQRHADCDALRRSQFAQQPK